MKPGILLLVTGWLVANAFATGFAGFPDRINSINP
jgi:hypothetical protein